MSSGDAPASTRQAALAMNRLASGVRQAAVERYSSAVGGVAGQSAADWLAVEEPLEIRISGEPWLTTMRTPGHDRELTVGLLLAEGIITSRDDLGSIVHCGRPGNPEYGNVIEVTPASGAAIAWDKLDAGRRSGITTSACGVCGRTTIDDLRARCAPVATLGSVTPEVLLTLMRSLSTDQRNFALTGGVHAALLATPDGELLATFEDVGRHNAVDKVLGHWWLKQNKPAEGLLLLVSGRASFEIVQKAAASRCFGVASVSAPSSLAVETAQALNLLLIGFARSGGFNVYSAAERVAGCVTF